IRAISVPTWTEKNGQDDIAWKTAERQANGDYKFTVKASEHKGESGIYNSHVYMVEADGNLVGLGGQQVNLNLPKPSAKIAIQNLNNNAGT
ncbi:GBS Bsp-like repeat-containing protein, partial [Streptococcus sp. DD10]|uniref:GBS Bsp-like repeat-containing protein n=1 Tax=Streptococcus sp. DD10 TaxID=1777878 RepID=UPI000A924EFD